MRSAIMSGAMALPLKQVDATALRKALTVKHLPMGEEVATLVEAFDIDKDFIHVPRQFGLAYCKRNGIPVEDKTSPGSPITFPRAPTPRDYQTHILDAIEQKFDSFYDFIFRAHTGWGKTIGSLIVAARLGTTTLIVVDQDNLKDQWLKALREHFGLTLENGGVGVIQGGKCDYHGKTVVIAMIQTLSQRKYKKEVYDYFGFVIFDETHTVGAPTFSRVLRLFAATYRMGVSATPKRKDSLQKLLDWNLGAVRVAADKEHKESAVYYVEHDTVYSWYANISPKAGRILSEVSEDGSRNLLLAEVTKSLYETGRDVLVLADRIEQLKHLMSLMYYMGVDEDDMGLYAGYDPIFAYAKETKPKRKPAGWDRESEFTPISLQLISKRIPKKKLDATRKSARILFATYGMCAKGFDEPRLKAGVDATPRSEVEQIHGRILREVIGSLMPIWVTVRDVNSYRLMYQFARRITGFAKSNGRIYFWDKDGVITEWDAEEVAATAWERHRELKSMRIETSSDGRNTLLTSQSVKAQKMQLAKDTVRRIRSSRAD